MRDVLLPFESDLKVVLASTIVLERGIPLMRDGSGIPEGWLLLIGIPPSGRILGSSILVVPLVTLKL